MGGRGGESESEGGGEGREGTDFSRTETASGSTPVLCVFVRARAHYFLQSDGASLADPRPGGRVSAQTASPPPPLPRPPAQERAAAAARMAGPPDTVLRWHRARAVIGAGPAGYVYQVRLRTRARASAPAKAWWMWDREGESVGVAGRGRGGGERE